MDLVIVTTHKETTMSVVITKFILSILLTIVIASMLAILIYWILTVLTVLSSMLGFQRLSNFFANRSVAFTSALERAYKSIRY